MKNVSLGLNVVLTVAVIILYVLHFSGSKTTENEAVNADATTENVASPTSNIVYVNVDSLLTNYDFYTDMREVLMNKQKSIESNISNKAATFERKMRDYQMKVQKQLVTRRQAEEMEQQLTQEQQGIVKLRDDLSRQFAQEEMLMNKQLYDSIASFLNDYNAIHKNQYVISTTVGGTLLYADEKYNITNAVIDGLNQRYGKEKTEEAK